MEIVKVSSKGQIVLPKSIREKLGIKEGNKLILVEKDGILLIRKEEEVESLILEQYFDKIFLKISEASFSKVWDNEEDEKIWKEYL